MWQIILFIVLAVIFVAMFLLGLAILKAKAEEADPDIHPSTDRLFSDRAARASRASRWVGTRGMTTEERKGAEQSDIFTTVTSTPSASSARLSDINQIINSTLGNNRNLSGGTDTPTIPDPNDFWADYIRETNVSPTPPPEPKPTPPPEPEEVIPERESLNAIDDLDLS